MSKLYLEYLKKKNKDKEKYYLFKSGIFYIFIEDDAYRINKYIDLKITKLNDEVVKCGFPIKNIDKYMALFKDNNLDIEIVDNSDKIKDVIKYINKIDINSINGIEAINILNNIKEKLDEWFRRFNDI